MKGITPLRSSGRGFATLRNCLFGVWVLVFAFKQNSIYLARNSSEIIEIIAGFLIILFSLYDIYIKKEENTVWGISTWILGGLILIMGTVFYLCKNSLF